MRCKRNNWCDVGDLDMRGLIMEEGLEIWPPWATMGHRREQVQHQNANGRRYRLHFYRKHDAERHTTAMALTAQ